jgi:hypothetical protein
MRPTHTANQSTTNTAYIGSVPNTAAAAGDQHALRKPERWA